jgi:hypothetical protein
VSVKRGPGEQTGQLFTQTFGEQEAKSHFDSSELRTHELQIETMF